MRRVRRAAVKSSSENYDSVTHQVMMLRFRPIAPKPAPGEAVSTPLKVMGTRRKRKYVKVRARKNKKERGSEIVRQQSPPEKIGVEDDSSPHKGVETLQLMLERSDSTVCTDKSCGYGTVQQINEENWNVTGDEVKLKLNTSSGASAAAGIFRSVIKTWIIVECVTDTLIESGVGLGLSDRDKINSLRADTCPGFISDGTEKVVWINEAYRKMVEEEENGVMVWLAVKEELPKYSPAFACRVRMSQQTKQGYKRNRTLACDVWRMMEFAGFAWKLDVNTALGLGI